MSSWHCQQCNTYTDPQSLHGGYCLDCVEQQDQTLFNLYKAGRKLLSILEDDLNYRPDDEKANELAECKKVFKVEGF